MRDKKRQPKNVTAKTLDTSRGKALKFYPRLGIFKTPSDHLTFDPLTLEARSYRWYSIARKLKGKLVLNDYAYSVTTRKHTGILQQLFRELGLSYVSIEAPQGLQNLDAACAHSALAWQACKLANAHARKPLLAHEASLKARYELCKRLGGRLRDGATLASLAQRALDQRQARLARAKAKRALAKAQAAKLKLVTVGELLQKYPTEAL